MRLRTLVIIGLVLESQIWFNSGSNSHQQCTRNNAPRFFVRRAIPCLGYLGTFLVLDVMITKSAVARDRTKISHRSWSLSRYECGKKSSVLFFTNSPSPILYSDRYLYTILLTTILFNMRFCQ